MSASSVGWMTRPPSSPCPISTPSSSSEIDQDLETIESVVRPHGPGLVDLYFRIVHPSYPVLHKGVFREKYARSYKEFSPPLLAAVYLLAMDWWEYDRELSLHEKPDSLVLLRGRYQDHDGRDTSAEALLGPGRLATPTALGRRLLGADDAAGRHWRGARPPRRLLHVEHTRVGEGTPAPARVGDLHAG